MDNTSTLGATSNGNGSPLSFATSTRHGTVCAAALASAAAQTVPCRVLVANDSGEPLPFEVAPNVEVLSIPPPPLGYERGQRAAHARNYALRHVKTPLVTFLDADDAFTPPAIEVMLKAWEQDSSKYVYGDAHTIDNNGNFGTWTAKAYKPDLLLQHNIHTITTPVRASQFTACPNRVYGNACPLHPHPAQPHGLSNSKITAAVGVVTPLELV